MRTRRAAPGEARLLSQLALESKAHWGYDREFLEACREELTLAPEWIAATEVRVLEAEGRIVGFYSLVKAEGPREDELELEHFFVDPEAIGQGFGRLLWEDAITTADELGVRRLTIHSDPYAEVFYRRMGAECVGEVPSGSIPGRTLPLMHFSLTEKDIDR